MKIKFQSLQYQKEAVHSISDVFSGALFYKSQDYQSNPILDLDASRDLLMKNIGIIRENNKVTLGNIQVDNELTVDILMETGTGKTFTFLESIFKLNRDYNISKFVILVPSNAIRQGTIKNIQITKDFFKGEYKKILNVYDYNEKTVGSYINESDKNIAILVSTYQSFNKASNSINKRGVERSLLGNAKSYMEAIAHLRPVVIIDEPHRFEGKQTIKHLKNFNPLFTLRFGATFKNDEFCNLVYTLDSVEAFSKGLVKSITVDTVGNQNINEHTLLLKKVSGSNQKDYIATIEYKDISAKTHTIDISKGTNLGEVAGISYLNGYIVEKITKTEVFFLNDISLSLGEISSYSMLLEIMQKEIINTAIKNHFEREEKLFKLGIKSLCLFFIDRVDKYLLDGGEQGDLASLFETIYAKHLKKILAKDSLDIGYRKYLERTQKNIGKIHAGYFAKSKSLKAQEEAVDLILRKKEELLSFVNDLRFIFSQWALQEGWDNPNVMTLCKLAPSNSKISKLQQIGRGLRLAVDKHGNRITREHPHFDDINELLVVVPSTEEDFVSGIQDDIAKHSLVKISKFFTEDAMLENNICTTSRSACRLIDKLEELKIIQITANDMSEIIILQNEYIEKRKLLKKIDFKGCDVDKLINFLDSYFDINNQVRSKASRHTKPHIKINKLQFEKFKELWSILNAKSLIQYKVDTEKLIKKAVKNININLNVSGQDILIKRESKVEYNLQHKASSTETIRTETHSIFTLYEFVKQLANNTKLSINTIMQVLALIDEDKFKLIAKNENIALKKITYILIDAIYDVIVKKISYKVISTKVCNTSLTDSSGGVLEYINKGTTGRDEYPIVDKNIICKSLYDENFMEIDSQIEGLTIDESNDKRIVVFAKLPRVNIPTIHGKSYNPDFGYVIQEGGQKSLYFIVETKGVDDIKKISKEETVKIESAKVFFETMKKRGYNVHYESKINSDQLSQMIDDIL